MAGLVTPGPARAVPAPADPAICVQARDGRLLARLPAGEGGAFALTFIHSVSRTPVRDEYRVVAGRIVQTAEIFEAHGAGLPSFADDVGATGWRHRDGHFVIDLERPTGPIHVRVQGEYVNAIHAGGTDLALASLGERAVTVVPCAGETAR